MGISWFMARTTRWDHLRGTGFCPPQWLNALKICSDVFAPTLQSVKHLEKKNQKSNNDRGPQYRLFDRIILRSSVCPSKSAWVPQDYDVEMGASLGRFGATSLKQRADLTLAGQTSGIGIVQTRRINQSCAIHKPSQVWQNGTCFSGCPLLSVFFCLWNPSRSLRLFLTHANWASNSLASELSARMHSSQDRSCQAVAGCRTNKKPKNRALVASAFNNPLVSVSTIYCWLHIFEYLFTCCAPRQQLTSTFPSQIPTPKPCNKGTYEDMSLGVLHGIGRFSCWWFSQAYMYGLHGYSSQFTPCKCSILEIKDTCNWITEIKDTHNWTTYISLDFLCCRFFFSWTELLMRFWRILLILFVSFSRISYTIEKFHHHIQCSTKWNPIPEEGGPFYLTINIFLFNEHE
jgi:hypothetical protein